MAITRKAHPMLLGGLFDSARILVIIMVSLFLYIFGLVVTLGAAWMAAVSDIRAYRIPNVASVLVLGGFAIAYAGILLLPGSQVVLLAPIKAHLISAAIMFLFTLVLFVTRMVGAGDAKFASALSVWLTIHPGLIMFVFYSSLIGGVMGIATIALRRFKPFKSPKAGTWVAASQEGQNRIPYGLALSGGFVLTLAALGYLNITAIINAVENVE